MAIGTISADATITVQYLKGEKLGSVDESFIARLKAGDTFTFAGRTLEFVRLHDMIAWVRKASKISGSIPRWTGGRMPLSDELATAIRAKLAEVRAGIFDDPEIEALRPILALQNRWSRIPDVGELLVERVKTREGYHLFFFPFEGRSVHEGLAALVAHRLAQREPLSFTLAANDYGFELLAPTPPTLSADDVPALFSPVRLTDDIVAALNAAELARRQFREIARVAGLIVVGTPSERRSARQLQASSNLFYDVFEQYDPENLLLHQARREVLERQLEQSRLRNALERISAGRMMFVEVARPTPFAFPLLVDRLRESLSTEKVEDRVRRMQMQLEKAAG
jgi:ATP-dependent Lhr-like helicase